MLAAMPRECIAVTSGPIGRLRIASSPSMVTIPLQSAAAAVRKRVAVPALPRNSGPPGALRNPALVTTKLVSFGSSTNTPICRSAAAIRVVSLDLSAPVRRLVPRARAASSNARLVIDLLPGGVTRPMSGCMGGVMASGGEDMVTPVAYARRQRKRRLPPRCGEGDGGAPEISTATAAATSSDATSLVHPGIGDFNVDGKPDIVWRNVGGTMVAWEMNGCTKLADGSGSEERALSMRD